MELIEKYRSQCYKENFKSSYYWVSFSTRREEFISLLNELQAGDRSSSSFNINDIDYIFSEMDKLVYHPNYTTKLVMQTANFDVKPQTMKSGCTTRLLFFLKVDSNWYFYGHAKGLFKDWGLFNIKKGEKLGYSIFRSLSEKDNEVSCSVPDNSSILRLKELLQRNKSKLSD